MVPAFALRRIGLGFAALALFFQLALGAAVVDGAAVHRRHAAVGLCHGGDGPARHAPAHMPDCPLCPHSLALHAGPVLPCGAVAIFGPPPRSVPATLWGGGARAPPGFAFARAFARGPPTLS